MTKKHAKLLSMQRVWLNCVHVVLVCKSAIYLVFYLRPNKKVSVKGIPTLPGNLNLLVKYVLKRVSCGSKYVLKRVSFGSKECIKELKLECAYFLGQTS